MKAKHLLTILLSFSCYLLYSQVPQGFNYQAVARTSAGTLIASTDLQVKASILSDTITPVVEWEELHSSVKTNPYGVFTVVIGTGAKQSGSALTFNTINWMKAPLYLKIQVYFQNSWKDMGISKLWSVPYSMFSGSLPTLSKLAVSGIESSPDSALFAVKNRNGQIVFAVYNEGVRVYVDDGVNKGPKGGFAIGGFGSVKGVSQNFLTVTPDSVRVYVDKSSAKGPKGGFAIGGFGSMKSEPENFLQLTPDNYFIGHNSGKHITTGLYNSFLGYMSGYQNTTGSSNTFFGDSTGLNNISGSWNVFLGKDAGYSNETSVSNVFIGNEAGKMAKHSSTSTGSYNVAVGTLAGYNNNGRFNVFLGQEAGYSNLNGKQNVFIGTDAGYMNDTASYNVAIGTDAGFNNMGIAGVFIGNFAGRENLGANYNVFIGNSAGRNNTTGDKNVILGSDAGYANTTGRRNIFVGNLAGRSNETGEYNLFAGSQAGYSNIEGGYNVFLGTNAGMDANGSYNTIVGNAAGEVLNGNYNTIVGFQSGIASGESTGNAFFGHQSGHDNLTGTYNTYIGPNAGHQNTSGSFNVMLGNYAGYSNLIGSNNVFLGKWAGYYETGSDKLYIDNSDSYSSEALIYGDFAADALRLNATVGINSAPSSSYQLYVTGSIYSTVGFYYPSDIRLKQNIKSMEGDGVVEKVRDITVIKYNYKSEMVKSDTTSTPKYIGVIAQDIEKSFPQAVNTDANGYKAVNLNALTAILLQAIKDQQKQIDTLKKEIEELKLRK